MKNKYYSEGTIIYPIRNTNGHSYTIGKPYIISQIDTDGTFIAKDPQTGEEGNWIKWEDVTLVQPIGWFWLKQFLPSEIVNILELFDGIESIILKDDWKNKVLMEFPDLYSYLNDLGNKISKEEKNENLDLNDKNADILYFPQEKTNISKTINTLNNEDFDIKSGNKSHTTLLRKYLLDKISNLKNISGINEVNIDFKSDNKEEKTNSSKDLSGKIESTDNSDDGTNNDDDN